MNSFVISFKAWFLSVIEAIFIYSLLCIVNNLTHNINIELFMFWWCLFRIKLNKYPIDKNTRSDHNP